MILTGVESQQMVICVVALAWISPASPALVRLAANHFSTPLLPRQYHIERRLVQQFASSTNNVAIYIPDSCVEQA